jgi:molybdopterin-containing oxidoreductase family iron-sulfur binding subunit
MTEEKLWQIIRRQDADDKSCAATDMPQAVMPRRTFIELVGFSIAAAALSGCRAPEQKIIPYVRQPVELTPGVANWYASTCGGCNAACGTLVKVRDGRPIKLEGNTEHPLSRGGLCAVAHGLVFGLYDGERLRQPLIKSQAATWEDVDQQINWQLTTIKQSGGKVRVLSLPTSSPTSRETIDNFLKQFADGKHIVYSAVSNAAIGAAHGKTHKVTALPTFHFDKAKTIVSFGADFLGTWLSPMQFTRAYTEARNLQNEKHELPRHIQFESRLSLAGSNADTRVKVSPAEEMFALLLLAKLIAEKAGVTNQNDFAAINAERLSAKARQVVEKSAEELWQHRGAALVISGANNTDAQQLVNFINQTLGNYGKTLEVNSASEQRLEKDSDMVELVREMNAGEVAALIIVDANPAYDFYNSREFKNGLAKVGLKVSLNAYLDETSALLDYVCPRNHQLESWDDAEPATNIFSLSQPTIAPLFQTRAWQESLLRWSNDERKFYDVLRARWQEKLFSQQNKHASFDEFWDNALHDGVFVIEAKTSTTPAAMTMNTKASTMLATNAVTAKTAAAQTLIATTTKTSTVQTAFVADDLNAAVKRLAQCADEAADKMNLVLYEKLALRDGSQANNPWLQELPDPITKVTWDNYACVSPTLADKLKLEEGRVVRISKGEASVEIPVHIQPQQHDDCIAIAVGYGRTRAGKVGNGVGTNAYPFVAFQNGTFQYQASDIAIEKMLTKVDLALTQLHNTLEGRPLIEEFTLAEFLEKRRSGQDRAEHSKSIWKDHAYPEHKWGMVIDLNACTGCSACLLSCQAENNVPVVGKDEVRRQREMHWLRIDRYFEGDDESERVVYQPVMCAQCENAACESVCPVLATVHSSEGLNMQVYNRCVGTRYCANNCAYKVRRFNWFEYQHSDPIANLALNPDVTVRTRGVMEKCTFCVQRIEEAKIHARNENREIEDGEIQTACQQSCPAQAITFGDLVNLESRANKFKHDKRDFILLEELNLRPAISYLAKVRNTEEEKA